MVSKSIALKGTPSLSNKPFTCSKGSGSALVSKHANTPQHLGQKQESRSWRFCCKISHSSTEGAVGSGIHNDWVFLQAQELESAIG